MNNGTSIREGSLKGPLNQLNYNNISNYEVASSGGYAIINEEPFDEYELGLGVYKSGLFILDTNNLPKNGYGLFMGLVIPYNQAIYHPANQYDDFIERQPKTKYLIFLEMYELTGYNETFSRFQVLGELASTDSAETILFRSLGLN